MSTRAWGMVAVILLLVLAGCDGESESDTESTDESSTEATEDETTETTEDEASDTVAVPEDPGVFVAPEAPENGCTFGEPSVAWQRPGWFDVEPGFRGFFVGGSASHGSYEMAFLAAVSSGGGTHVMARTRLESPVPEGHRRSSPALAITEEHGALALVDGQRRLLLARFEPRSARALNFQVVAENASLRFSPALLRVDRAWWVAWTEEQDEGRRVLVRRAPDGGDPSGPQDLTPDAGGGAAPAFVAGAETPTLVFLDAREGTSVAHLATLAGEAFAEPQVGRPVSAVTDPPEIAAVQIGGSQFLTYTGVGNAATTAVGFVPLAGTDDPMPVVPGTGYGVLHTDVTPMGGGAIIVADAPLESPPESPREIQVRRVSATGAMSDATIVRGPSESTTQGRVAVFRDVLAVAFRSEVGVHVSIGRCAGGSASSDDSSDDEE